jgi:hypothetical protein
MRELLPGVPLIHSPFFEEILAEADWDAETRRVAADLNRDGFAVIDFPEPELDTLAADIAETVFAPLEWDRWRAGELHELRVAEACRRTRACVASRPTPKSRTCCRPSTGARPSRSRR